MINEKKKQTKGEGGHPQTKKIKMEKKRGEKEGDQNRDQLGGKKPYRNWGNDKAMGNNHQPFRERSTIIKKRRTGCPKVKKLAKKQSRCGE